jgi:hypothetical protein
MALLGSLTQEPTRKSPENGALFKGPRARFPIVIVPSTADRHEVRT